MKNVKLLIEDAAGEVVNERQLLLQDGDKLVARVTKEIPLSKYDEIGGKLVDMLNSPNAVMMIPDFIELSVLRVRE